MIKFLGKLLVLLLYTSVIHGTPAVSLKLTTMDNAPLKQAGAGQPFLLHVVITQANNTAQYPVLKGVDTIHVRQSGFQMNMINGATSITYQYRVRIDTPGVYTLGPAQITEGTDVIASAPITVTVAQEQTAEGMKTSSANQNSTATFLRLSCDKDKVVVGQKIGCTLTFYTADPAVVLQSLINPEQDCPGFIIKDKQEPLTGTQIIGGVEHRYAKWHWNLYPTKAGNCVIPAYAADFTTKSNNQMFSFFFARNDAKRTYSNTINLTVDPLPNMKEPLPFVGTIKNFIAKIDPIIASLGEGMVLTLAITGDGDFERVAMLPLQQVPAGLKWYESKQYNERSKTDESTTHTMEYIVQALEPGIFSISPQTFTYFDTGERAYKTVKTQALTLNVVMNAAVVNKGVSKPIDNDIASSLVIGQEDEIRPIHQEGPWVAKPVAFIPWVVYWFLILAIVIIWGLLIFIKIYRREIFEFFARYRKNNSAYAVARKQIVIAHKKHDAGAFYSIFMTLLEKYTGIRAAQLSPEIVDQQLAQAGLSAPAIDDWRLFFAQLCQARFYQQSHDAVFYTQLKEKSLYWIDILEKLAGGK